MEAIGAAAVVEGILEAIGVVLIGDSPRFEEEGWEVERAVVVDTSGGLFPSLMMAVSFLTASVMASSSSSSLDISLETSRTTSSGVDIAESFAGADAAGRVEACGLS